MKMKTPKLLLVGMLAFIPAFLTSCPRPPVYEPGVQLYFKLPDAAIGQKLKLAAVYYELQADGKTTELKVLSQGYGYGGGYDVNGNLTDTSQNMYLDGYSLKTLSGNTKCVTPFKTGEAKDMQKVTITPDTVKTCNIFFLAYQDANNDNKPTGSEERYNTHDLYGYASEAFDYSMTTADGNSTESGKRTQGWSLVRHTVLQPSATPGKYLVSMNSVPTDDLSLDIRMHEPTNFMISMSVGGQK